MSAAVCRPVNRVETPLKCYMGGVLGIVDILKILMHAAILEYEPFPAWDPEHLLAWGLGCA